jgi:D-alanyl-D-alanine carboxypeptidase/D-alanyl-D-alanine-endopeptidase (penicillin-binding protein 4)
MGMPSYRTPRRESMWPVVLLLLVGAIPAVALGYVWQWADGKRSRPVVEADPPPVTTPRLATPVLSYRRAPQTLSSTISETTLVAKLNDVAAVVPDGSCFVASLNGRTLVDDGGDAKVTPASNQKLLTAVVALQRLGPSYTFTTELRGNLVEGVVQGDLYFVGGGDPVLSTSDYAASLTAYPPTVVTPIETLVTNLQALGVTRIQGRIIADDSRYDKERYVPSWAPSIVNVEAGPLSALMVNDATRTLGTVNRYADPTVGAAQVLDGLLRRAGIRLGGAPQAGVAPAEAAAITSVTSAPLSDILGELLTTSDDNTAELLLKEIGYTTNNLGTRESGLEVMRGTLVTLGIDTSQITLVDGSGLASENVVTCNILHQLVLAVLHDPDGKPIADGLPVGAETGTLADQFVGTRIAGRIHAKTGRLSNVRSLTGYIETDVGTIEFSMVLNFQGAGDNYTPIWLALAGATADFPSGPAVDALAPR